MRCMSQAMLPALALPRHLLDIRTILLKPEVESCARESTRDRGVLIGIPQD